MNIKILFTFMIFSSSAFAIDEPIVIGGKKYTKEQVLERCSQVKKKFVICDKLNQEQESSLPVENPVYGDFLKYKKENTNYALSLGYNALGNITGANIKLSREYENFGFGLTFSQVNFTETGLNNGKVTGMTYGALISYDINPNYIRKSNLNLYNPYVYITGGMTKFESDLEGTLPQYNMVNLGLGINKKIFKKTSIYTNVEFSEIYYKESGFLHLGTSLMIGIKFDFGN